MQDKAGKPTILVLQKGHVSFFLFINFADSIIQYIPSGVVVSRRYGFNDFFLSLANFLLFFLEGIFDPFCLHIFTFFSCIFRLRILSRVAFCLFCADVRN